MNTEVAYHFSSPTAWQHNLSSIDYSYNASLRGECRNQFKPLTTWDLGDLLMLITRRTGIFGVNDNRLRWPISGAHHATEQANVVVVGFPNC